LDRQIGPNPCSGSARISYSPSLAIIANTIILILQNTYLEEKIKIKVLVHQEDSMVFFIAEQKYQ